MPCYWPDKVIFFCSAVFCLFVVVVFNEGPFLNHFADEAKCIWLPVPFNNSSGAIQYYTGVV